MHIYAECEEHVGYMYCRKDNGAILKTQLQWNLEIIQQLLHSFSFNNQHSPIPNIFVISNLAFLVILVNKTFLLQNDVLNICYILKNG